MPSYAIAVTCTVILSAVIMFLIFFRLKVLNFRTLLSIMLASAISAFALPGIYNLIFSWKSGGSGASVFIVATAASFAAYLVLVFALSLFISYIVPKISLKPGRAAPLPAEAFEGGAAAEADDVTPKEENYLEQIFVNFIGDKQENSTNMSDNEENAIIEENNLEKSVDSVENIDKMGIENNMHDRDTLTIEECIDEAFRLKESGDSEGAILYYMYALDKKPRKELTFWIVLDICVMYKALGQRELALDILNSYYDIYGDIMDGSVKEEIELYLTDIRA